VHEIGICESVLAAVERRAEGRPVDGFTVRVGTLLRVAPEAFAQSFELVAAGSIADGAEPELEFVPVSCACEQCGRTFDSEDPMPICPACDSVRVTRSGGDDLVLTAIRYRTT
jgi:hydrogenase nickel incorporation protein HypA/HybF